MPPGRNRRCAVPSSRDVAQRRGGEHVHAAAGSEGQGGKPADAFAAVLCSRSNAMRTVRNAMESGPLGLSAKLFMTS